LDAFGVHARYHPSVPLREHFRRGLELAPLLRFELDQVFDCPGGYEREQA
jgi:hypothetical protein